MGKRLLIVLASLVAVAALVVGAIFFYGFVKSSVEADDAGETYSSSGARTEDDEDFGSVEIYDVLTDGSLEPAASGLTLTVWETFVRVVTPDFAAEVMSQYRVGDAPDSDTLAYVYQDDDPVFWILAANLATSENEADLVATLVHEYAHILTLTSAEMDTHAASCETIELSEGCALGDSYLFAFEQQFWSGYDEAAPTPDNEDGDAAYEFYLAHEDDFVSDYAATNVVEDIAECFSAFVLEDKPSGDSVTAQKLDFFWQFPELEAIRERIRAEFEDDLGLVG